MILCIFWQWTNVGQDILWSSFWFENITVNEEAWQLFCDGQGNNLEQVFMRAGRVWRKPTSRYVCVHIEERRPFNVIRWWHNKWLFFMYSRRGSLTNDKNHPRFVENGIRELLFANPVTTYECYGAHVGYNE